MEIELGKLTIEDIVHDKKEEHHYIKKLIMESSRYPSIEIRQLDLCPDGSETFDVHIDICAHMTKDQLFEFLKVANDKTSFMMNRVEERFPGRITVETFPDVEDLKKDD